MFASREVAASARLCSPARGSRAEMKEDSLMWNLNAQLVEDHHMTAFEMLIHGVISNWPACRMEPGLWLVDSVRGYRMHTHSGVISVLADLLMLTCSACLLGSLTSPLFVLFGNFYLLPSWFSMLRLSSDGFLWQLIIKSFLDFYYYFVWRSKMLTSIEWVWNVCVWVFPRICKHFICFLAKSRTHCSTGLRSRSQKWKLSENLHLNLF